MMIDTDYILILVTLAIGIFAFILGYIAAQSEIKKNIRQDFSKEYIAGLSDQEYRKYTEYIATVERYMRM